MINRASILQWRTQAPWNNAEQVERDLIICRALTTIFGDGFLASQLDFPPGKVVKGPLLPFFPALSFTPRFSVL
jgi:hypothetical protein